MENFDIQFCRGIYDKKVWRVFIKKDPKVQKFAEISGISDSSLCSEPFVNMVAVRALESGLSVYKSGQGELKLA